jgi:hypothetical protein
MDWAAVAHPQTNGQVERANGMILHGLKPRILDKMNNSGQKCFMSYRRSFRASGPLRARPQDSRYFS